MTPKPMSSYSSKLFGAAFFLVIVPAVGGFAREGSAQVIDGLPAKNSAATANPNRDLDRDKERKGPAPNALSNSYALIIGIAAYKNLPALAQLQFPARDAEGIYQTLLSLKGGQFRAENIHLLIDQQASAANIKRELTEWLPSVAKDNDRVLIFFCGHGFVYKRRGWLAGYDTDLKDMPQTSISMELLGSVLGKSIRAKWKVLLVDACHSGAITPEADTTDLNQSMDRQIKSVFSLTATRDREQSFEDRALGGGHGVFTYYVIKGLSGEADANGDGIVDADELSYYVHRSVRLATDGRQNSTSERGSFDPHMVLAIDPAKQLQAVSQVNSLGSLLVRVNLDYTEIFVDDKSAGFVGRRNPLLLSDIVPGEHQVRAHQPSGVKDWSTVETVYPGQQAHIDVHLTRRNPEEVTAWSAPPQSPLATVSALSKETPQGPPVSHGYALIIGISSYLNLPAAAQLKYADRDADAIFKTITDAKSGQFARENVHELIDGQATLANIRSELENWLPSVAGEEDHVLIYFAGHGTLARGVGYLAPFDVSPQDVARTGYSMSALGTSVVRIKAKWKVLITDACHSGVLAPEADREKLNDGLLGLDQSLFSLTASRDREKSFEGEKWGGGHGVFTYYVVLGLLGDADIDNDGVVDADELNEYVSEGVRFATNGQQNPTSERGSYDSKMVLSHSAQQSENNEPEVTFP